VIASANALAAESESVNAECCDDAIVIAVVTSALTMAPQRAESGASWRGHGWPLVTSRCRRRLELVVPRQGPVGHQNHSQVEEELV